MPIRCCTGPNLWQRRVRIMRFLLYTHSLLSDWNHGNAHFLRGVLRELQVRGHTTLALEPEDSWSRLNLLADQGHAPLEQFHRDFPELQSVIYGADRSEEHTSELQSLMRISYAVFCLKKK